MIDPFTALAAVNTAIKLVKTTVKTCQNLESLGPCLSQFFGAKEQAIAVVKAGGFKGSALGKAIELELLLESAKQYEESIKMLFFQSNKMDVWQKIVSRAAKMTSDQIQSDRREREAAARKKKEMDEVIEIVLLVLVFFALIGGIAYLSFEVLAQCAGKCSFQKG